MVRPGPRGPHRSRHDRSAAQRGRRGQGARRRGGRARWLARLVEHHYLDDEEFARYWLDNRSRFRPRSAKAIRYELRQKGVDSDAIDAALEGMDEDDAAWDAAASKLDRWRNLPEDEFEHKLSGFLARRGFGYSTIRRTVQRAWKAVQEPE